MRYLKKFNESVDNVMENLNGLIIDLVDLYNFELVKGSGSEMVYAFKNTLLSIKKSWILDQEAWIIEIYDRDNMLLIVDNYAKDIDCFRDKEAGKIMVDAAELGKMLLNSPEVSMGSFKNHFYIVYFSKKIDKKYNIQDMYGAHVIKELTNGFIHSNSLSHRNCFDLYKDNRIDGMYSLLSYYDNWFYQRPLSVVSKGSSYESLAKIWEETCDRLGIKHFHRVFKNFKITVPEFMDVIKEYDKKEPIK